MKVNRPLALCSVLLISACSIEDNVQTVEFEGPGTQSPKSLYTGNNEKQTEQVIKNALLKMYAEKQDFPVYALEDAIAVTSVNADSMQTEIKSEEGVSQTNTIEENVDEADIIKHLNIQQNDYLFVAEQPSYWLNEATNAKINVFDINSDATNELVDTINLPEQSLYIQGMYTVEVQGKPSLLTLSYNQDSSQLDWQNLGYWNGGFGGITLTDLSNPEFPDLFTMEYEGHLTDSRIIDNQLYLVSRFSPDVSYFPFPENEEIAQSNAQKINDLSLNDLMPTVKFNQSDWQTKINAQKCLLPNDEDSFNRGYLAFTNIYKIDLNNPDQFQTLCVLTPASGISVNEKSLYIMDNQFWWNSQSRAHRFDLESFSYHSSVNLEGRLGWQNPEFRFREFEQNGKQILTAATESFDQESQNIKNLFTLFEVNNSSIDQVSQLPNESRPEPIGKPNERIRAARINENTAQLVTFLQTDPLYNIDISDIYNPYISGQLEEPGFSAYLHNFDNNLQIGLGYNANEQGQTKELKLSLYDIANGQATKLQDILLPATNGQGYSPAIWEHKAFTYLEQNDGTVKLSIPVNLYQFNEQCADWWQCDSRQTFYGLATFNINPLEKTLTFNGYASVQKDNSYGHYQQDRSVIQGNTLHYAHEGKLHSFWWQDLNTSLPTL